MHNACRTTIAVVRPLAAAVAVNILALSPSMAESNVSFRYTHAAAAFTHCTARSLTMLEETRLGLLIIGESEERTSLAEVSEHLRNALTKTDTACAAPQTQAEIRSFSTDVLPRLQAPIRR